jgi:exosome complex component RRP45
MVKVLEPSVNETEFLLSALTEGKRVDGRGVYDVRSVEILLGADYGQVEVQLGRTRYSRGYLPWFVRIFSHSPHL